MTEIDKAIKHFESLQKRYTTLHNGVQCELVKTALEALREYAERQDPKPLTVEELRACDNTPLWIDIKSEASMWLLCNGELPGDSNKINFAGYFEMNLILDYYGETWWAYRHKPRKDETK